tara:strand:+ start:1313 stop:2182 length:870 start_codon:yes stop_codon:yes gene_type:complete
MKIKILIPVYNDWQSVFKVLNEINNLSIDSKFQISIIIINDASNHDRPNIDENFDNISSLKILNLKKNQGHTRGIATAMKYVYEKDDFDYVIPMDGDGEDRPEEIKNFLNKIDVTNGNAIVGERVKRSEDLLFKSCYLIHKLITLVFTGQSIKFGNYTCLPKSTVKKMIDEKATWNSFSGALKKVEKNLISIPSIRGPRYFGPSQMNFQKLLKHSLCIMSVFRNTFLIRSALFVVLYILLIKSNASIITGMPLILLLIAVYSISNLALRENMEEFDQSLSNINNIDSIK